jgi:hypothetical protein
MPALKPILIISYYWPPGSGPGVQRWLKFCKYLPEQGWQPIVLTVKNGSYPAYDNSLLNEVPNDVLVYRTNTIEPFEIYNLLRGKKGKSVEVGMGNIKDPKGGFAKLANYVRANFFIPDARMGWNSFAYAEAKKIIAKHKPEVIITTGPPHSTHLVGLKLKRDFQLPWIADFRDPWTEIFYNQFLNRTGKSILKDKKLEQQVLEKSNLLLAATPSIEKLYRNKASNIKVILNGYDSSDFSELTELLSPSFNISFFGNMLPNQNIDNVWLAINELKTEGKLPNHFNFRIIGNVADNIKESIFNNGIFELVTFLPFLPHKEAVKEMQKSNMLFLPIPIDKGNKLILTGKIFEYLATKRPILSVGPKDGDAAEVLTACDQLPMLDYKDLPGIKRIILDAIERQNTHMKLEVIGNEHYLTLSRRAQASLLSETIKYLQTN